MLLGSDWKYDEFSVTQINSKIIKTLCKFDNKIENKQSFTFSKIFGTMLNRISGCGYDRTCKGSMGDPNCWHDGNQFMNELISKKQKPHLIKEDEYQSYNKWINGNFFKLHSYSDIWTYRFYKTLLAMLPLVENELKNMLHTTYKYNEHESAKLAEHYIAKSLELVLNGHHGKGLKVLYEDENKSEELKNWLLMQDKAIKEGYINPNIANEFSYDLYSFKNTDTQSLLLDHIEFMSKNKLKNILNFKNTNEFGKSLLMYSSHMNNFNSVQSILLFNNINYTTKKDEKEYSCSNVKLRGRSALTYACENGSKELIALLVQYGADVTILDSQQNSLEYYLKKNPYLSNEDKEKGMNLLTDLLTLDISHINPSFQCKMARTKYEKAVCSSATLANYDKSMSILYKKLKTRKNFDIIKSTQRKWNKNIKSSCKAYTIENDYKACLARELRNQTYWLQKVYEFEEVKSK